jgi:hypothetical protein
MKTMLILAVGCLFAASAASAAPFASPSGLSDQPIVRLVQDRGERAGDRGLSGRDRDQRRFSRDDDDMDRDGRGRYGAGRAYGMRGSMGAGGMGNMPAMQEHMHEHMKEAFGGARIRIGHGETGIDIRCPSDVPFNECTVAAEKILDRLNGTTSTAPGTTTR